jgi:hypothetical protein
MNAREFAKTLDADLLEKWQGQLDDPMMRRALQAIMDVRRSRERMLAARAENERIQSQNKKLRRPYFS